MSGPYLPEHLPECDGCGTPMVDWSDPMQAWLGKMDAREGSGCAEEYGGLTADDMRLCVNCWDEAKRDANAAASAASEAGSAEP